MERCFRIQEGWGGFEYLPEDDPLSSSDEVKLL